MVNQLNNDITVLTLISTQPIADCVEVILYLKDMFDMIV